MRVMKTLPALFTTALIALTVHVDEAFAADRNTPGPRATARRGLPAGLPRAHYSYRTTIISGPPVPYDAPPGTACSSHGSKYRPARRHPRAHYGYRTTIISGPPVPYDARPYAYGRYGYAPYINSYGIPAAVVVDPVDPAYYWRRPYYGPYVSGVYATPYSCFYYGSC
jgi:hypothetical protein